MTMVGVTGTNGKTSTVQLLAQAWTLLGTRSGTIGTLGAGLYGDVGADRLHHAAGAAGARAARANCAMPARRRWRWKSARTRSTRAASTRVRFDVAVFTNLTRDHLDYHGDMDAYGAAKARLFAWPGCARR